MTDVVNVKDLLDPELQPVLQAFELPAIDAEGVAAMRGASFASPDLSDAVTRTDHQVPGDPPVPVRVHRANDAEGLLPAIVTIHGGGYVIGSYDMDSPLLDRWCPNLGVVGVSVEYRLAPETSYPGPLEDCYAALRWTHDNADELGIDKDTHRHLRAQRRRRAGGRVGAARPRSRRGPALRSCCSTAPCSTTASARLPSRPTGSTSGASGSNDFGWRSYLGALSGSDEIPAYAAAARATDLAGLPPTCVVVGSIDGFRDEDIDYAQRLNQAGVDCELHVIAGLPHAYLLVPGAAAVQLAMHCMDDWLTRQLTRLSER